MCKETTVERTVKSQTGMPNQWRPKAMCLEQQFATGIESTSEPADPVLDEFSRSWSVCRMNEYMNEWMKLLQFQPTFPTEVKGGWGSCHLS